MDVARLGLIVDATGAKREIRLTTDELRKLADGGKLASASLKEVGAPATVQRLDLVTQATRRMQSEQRATEVGLSKMRQNMTSLAVAAGALPGPIGRIASSLAPLAIGGGITVGVLAGITAITYAWNRMTQGMRDGAALVRSAQQGEASMSPASMAARAQSLSGRERMLSGAMEAPNVAPAIGPFGPAIAAVSGWFAKRQIGEKLEETRERLAELNQAIAAVTRDLEGQLSNLTNPRSRTGIIQQSAVSAAGQAARRAGARPWGGPHAGINEAAYAAGQESRLQYNIGVQQAARTLAGEQLLLQISILDAEKKIRDTKIEQNRLTDHQIASDKVKYAIAMQLAGFAAQQIGSIGSNVQGGRVIGSIASGALAGASLGPWGALAGGVMGAVSGLLGLGSAARENRRQIERERAAREKLNEQLQTAIRNAPRGFFLESYFRGAISSGPPFNPNTPGGKPPTVTIVMAAGSVVVNGNRSDIEMARGVVRGIRQLASASGGTGMQIADAMERIN